MSQCPGGQEMKRNQAEQVREKKNYTKQNGELSDSIKCN